MSWTRIEVWVEAPEHPAEVLVEQIFDVCADWSEAHRIDTYESATLNAPAPDWADPKETR